MGSNVTGSIISLFEFILLLPPPPPNSKQSGVSVLSQLLHAEPVVKITCMASSLGQRKAAAGQVCACVWVYVVFATLTMTITCQWYVHSDLQ